MGKTLEGLHAKWRAARDELRALEQRLGVLLQEMNDKEVPAHDVQLTPENVEELQRLVEEERRLADAYRTAQKDERGRQTSDEVGLRARERAVADDDGMSQAD
jgi:hypothetical protein